MWDLTRACLTDLGIYVLQADLNKSKANFSFLTVSELLATVGTEWVGRHCNDKVTLKNEC